jgi:NADPH:quinone reductase-like Zn-dependent oxidoreductase
LIWGGAGGLGSMAIQIVKAAGATPVAIVSGEDKFDYCMKLGAKGCINRNEFDHWGMLPHWKDNAGYAKWLKGVRAFGAKIWEVLGEKRAPNIVFEHPGETTIPHLDLRLRHRRHGRGLRRHHRLQRHGRSALPMDAAKAVCKARTSPTPNNPTR